MTPPLDHLLAWYRSATQRLIASPRSLEAPPNGLALLDGEGLAMEELLRRQALSLLRLHDQAVAAATAEMVPNRETCDAKTNNTFRLLEQRLEDLASVSMSKLYAYRYDQVPYHWRRLYTEALILQTFYTILRDGAVGGGGWLGSAALDAIVEGLDRALITAGGAGVLGREWIERTVTLLEDLDCRVRTEKQQQQQQQDTQDTHHHNQESRPRKRTKYQETPHPHWLPTHEPYPRPGPLSGNRSCPRHGGWSLARFERYMNAERPPRPVIFTDLVSSWPALTDRPWKSREYLLRRTFGGRRLVPVEVGRSYVDEHWGQELMPFGDFLARYIVGGGGGGDEDDALTGHETGSTSASSSSSTSTSTPAAKQIGYLAQHDLFHQIPTLRNDVAIPDFCWSTVPGYPTPHEGLHKQQQQQQHAPLDEPLLNAWFGPARTITPLHTDSYHNLLVQVVGTKYVRLYAPWAEGMRPRGVENGVDMSNTSAWDVGVLEGWDEATGDGDADAEAETEEDAQEDRRRRARAQLERNEYWECILEEGDTLLIPMGWWHYVRSLSVSFSVSFWWN
ncbi:hypothetical protein E4U55_002274 [Claviceps digitariae]|nr:hypothetical protein E4U55_002274 [Claviceps digitariae]